MAFTPSNVPDLAGSAETSLTPFPMRSAVRLRSASLTGLPACWAAPGIIALRAPVLTSVVCSTVPLPSGFTVMSVALLMQPASASASAADPRPTARMTRMNPPARQAMAIILPILAPWGAKRAGRPW